MLHLFFQAEDGIRDGHVTGVQTCALPISTSWHHLLSAPRRLGLRLGCSASAVRCFDRRFSALEVHAPAFSCACTFHRVSKIAPRCVATAERAALEWVRSKPPPHGWCQLRQTCPSRWCCRRCQYARQ